MSPMDSDRYPADWDVMRRTAVALAEHRCQGCGCVGGEDGTTRTTLTVHHPDRDPENETARLTVLCASCHLRVEANARRVQADRLAALRHACSCGAGLDEPCHHDERPAGWPPHPERIQLGRRTTPGQLALTDGGDR